jgi:hypothetical protein
MREPWLFWGSLAFLPIAGICFVLAVRVTSERRRVVLEIVTQVIGGTAGILMGYERAFRSAAKDIWELKANTSVGLLLISGGLVAVVDAILKAFNK